MLGLTWPNIKAMILKRLGPRGKRILSTIENSVDLVKRLITEGPGALWDEMKEKIGDLKAMFVDALISWLKITIFKKGMEFLLPLLIPFTAIIKLVHTLYKVVTFFIDNWSRIVDFASSVMNSIREIAAWTEENDDNIVCFNTKDTTSSGSSILTLIESENYFVENIDFIFESNEYWMHWLKSEPMDKTAYGLYLYKVKIE